MLELMVAGVILFAYLFLHDWWTNSACYRAVRWHSGFGSGSAGGGRKDTSANRSDEESHDHDDGSDCVTNSAEDTEPPNGSTAVAVRERYPRVLEPFSFLNFFYKTWVIMCCNGFNFSFSSMLRRCNEQC
uniref:Putative secreted protein n=1 Tax=Anopheles darlingi TaxID=43151 RepID=A0A2M4DQL3_ANODA